MLPRIMVFPAAPIHQVAGVRRRVQMSQVSSSYMPPYLHSDSQWNFQSHKLSFADGGRVDSIQEHLWNRRVRPRARRYGRTGFELSTTGWLEDTYKKHITHGEAPPKRLLRHIPPGFLHSDSQYHFQSHKLSFAEGRRVGSIQEHLWNRRVRPRARRNGRTGFLVPHLGVFRQSMPELSTTGWLEDTYKKRITHQEAPPF